MKISQSLIKEVLKQDHCPKQIYYSFIRGKDLLEPSENMILGRYFESELLGACRGGEKQEARMIKTGKAKPFADCDDLVAFARKTLKSLGLDVNQGESQLEVESETLKGAIDHRNKDIKDPTRKANYDVKWTATKEDDRWNGWGDPETKDDAIIQAAHYTLVSYEETGEWLPFYFLVFGKTKWVKLLQFVLTEEAIEQHKSRIAHTSSVIREYATKSYKGTGSFNKCQSCLFISHCPDRTLKPEIETINI